MQHVCRNGWIIQPQAPAEDNTASTLTQQSHMPSLTPANPLVCAVAAIQLLLLVSSRKPLKTFNTYLFNSKNGVK